MTIVFFSLDAYEHSAVSQTKRVPRLYDFDSPVIERPDLESDHGIHSSDKARKVVSRSRHSAPIAPGCIKIAMDMYSRAKDV